MSFRKSEVNPLIYSREQHSISRSDIDPDALKILYRLSRHGHKAFLVGGGVRDLMLGKKPKDFDIGTDATPRQIKAIFRNSRIIGRRFKLVHVFFRGGKNIEVSTFRDLSDPIDETDDAEKDTASPAQDNNYGTESTDALRRDLTINGLFYDLKTFSIIDYVGGVKDLEDALIRVIGDPDKRFIEDPVRLLRVVRHAARCQFAIEDDCHRSMLKNHKLILKSSQVRVYEELKKDLCSGYSLEILRLLASYNILQHLLPELTANGGALLREQHDFSKSLERLDLMIRKGISVSPTVVLSLIALFVGSSDQAEETLPEKFSDKISIEEHVKDSFTNLQVPRKERERVSEVISIWHQLRKTPLEKMKIGSILKRPALPDVISLFRALKNTTHNEELLALLEDGAADHSPQMRRERGPQDKNRTRRGGHYGRRESRRIW